MAQLSYPQLTTGKIIVLTIWTLVGKVMSLLLNTLSRFVIALFQGASFINNSMAAVTAHSNLGAQGEKKNLSLFPLFPPLFAMK